MKRILFLLLCLSFASATYAQVATPLFFKSEDDNKILTETDSGNYYAASKDPDKTVFIGQDPITYRLFDKDHKLLVEGRLSADGDNYMREGKWTEYYDNGKMKSTGYYYRNHPIGTWQMFYTNGQPMKVCSYSLIENGASYYCMTGDYREYFENGSLKLSGFYKAVIDDKSNDTLMVEDPITGNSIPKLIPRPRPEKFGTWSSYNEQGELLKKEDIQ